MYTAAYDNRLGIIANELGYGDEEEEDDLKRSDVRVDPGLLHVLLSTPCISIFLIFIPLGIASYWMDWSKPIIFIFNFFAILPMAWLIGKCTDDLASHTTQVVGGLLNATFGNIVEMILCVQGIRHNEISVVQCTLVGSILSNVLLVLGSSFLYGGFYHQQQVFSQAGASAQSSLLLLAVLCLMLPTLYSVILSDTTDRAVIDVSRWSSLLMLITYGQYLLFQLKTHRHLFEDDDEEKEETELSKQSAIGTLAACTFLTSVCSDNLVVAIRPTVEAWDISKEFIGIIILPIIGNAAEHYTAVTAAGRNKMDLSLSIAVGSSCQMALLVTPFTVIAGWVMNKEMSLDFHPFQVAVMLVSVLIVNSSLVDGKSNWLEGSMLVTAYICIAMIYFFERTSSM